MHARFIYESRLRGCLCKRIELTGTGWDPCISGEHFKMGECVFSACGVTWRLTWTARDREQGRATLHYDAAGSMWRVAIINPEYPHECRDPLTGEWVDFKKLLDPLHGHRNPRIS